MYDFEVRCQREAATEEKALPGPYWNPAIEPHPRLKAFLGHVLRDFAQSWRHVLCRKLNSTVQKKLAYAAIWIASSDFTLVDQENSTGPFYYWDVFSMAEYEPTWKTPDTTLVQVGPSWFCVARDACDGLEMIQRHIKSQIRPENTTYVILTVRDVILCNVHDGELKWTRPET